MDSIFRRLRACNEGSGGLLAATVRGHQRHEVLQVWVMRVACSAAPNRITLRAMESGIWWCGRSGWHLRRGWYTTLAMLRVTAVPTPPLSIPERQAPDLPTFAELEHGRHICRWMDQQPQHTRTPSNAWYSGPAGPSGAGDVTVECCMACGSIGWCGTGMTAPGGCLRPGRSACSRSGMESPAPRANVSSRHPASVQPYWVAAGIDTWYLNRIDESGLPAHLRVTLDDLQALAKDEDDEVETPWEYRRRAAHNVPSRCKYESRWWCVVVLHPQELVANTADSQGAARRDRRLRPASAPSASGAAKAIRPVLYTSAWLHYVLLYPGKGSMTRESARSLARIRTTALSGNFLPTAAVRVRLPRLASGLFQCWW